MFCFPVMSTLCKRDTRYKIMTYELFKNRLPDKESRKRPHSAESTEEEEPKKKKPLNVEWVSDAVRWNCLVLGFFFLFHVFFFFKNFFCFSKIFLYYKKKWIKVSLSGSESSSIRNTILKDKISLLLNYDALPKVLILHSYWIRYVCILLTRFFT